MEDPRARSGDTDAELLGHYLHDPAVGLLRAAEARLLRDRAWPEPLLDLGCGDGSFARITLSRPVAVGLDHDLRRARRARARGVYRAVVVADAHRLPFLDGSFAAVLSNSTLEHLPGVGDVLREAARVVTDDGSLVFTVHNQRFARRAFFWPRLFAWIGQPEWSERYRRRRRRRLAMENLLDPTSWRALLAEAGFTTVEVRGYLAGRADLAFERLLVLGRFGIGRCHVGVLLRWANQALSRLGLRVHQRVLGRLLARLLARPLADDDGEPAADLYVARKRAAEGRVSARVLDLAANERWQRLR